MNIIKKIVLPLSLLTLLAIGGFLLIATSQTKIVKAYGDIPVLPFVYGTSTSTSNTITTSSSRVLATSTNKNLQYAAFVNTGSNPVYLCLYADATCTTAGIYLIGPGGSYEMILGQNMYLGSVTAVSTGGNSTLTVNTF